VSLDQLAAAQRKRVRSHRQDTKYTALPSNVALVFCTIDIHYLDVGPLQPEHPRQCAPNQRLPACVTSARAQEPLSIAFVVYCLARMGRNGRHFLVRCESYPCGTAVMPRYMFAASDEPQLARRCLPG
jgi:hypothetical protein